MKKYIVTFKEMTSGKVARIKVYGMNIQDAIETFEKNIKLKLISIKEKGRENK